MEIQRPGDWLPQQPPILLLDSAHIEEPGVSGIGRKAFTPEDPFFAGHFPNDPILPGVYLIEATAQTAMLVLFTGRTQDPSEAGQAGYLAKVDRFAFHHPVGPGDAVELRVTLKRKVDRFFMMDAQVYCGETLCARGALTLAMGEEDAGRS